MENHPPHTRFSTMIYVSENVLTPEVIQAIYRHKKSIDSIVTKHGDTWETMCKRMPIFKKENILQSIFGRKKRSIHEISKSPRNQTLENMEKELDVGVWGDEDWEEEEDLDWKDNGVSSQDEKINEVEQYSVSYYPKPYCDIIEGMETACLEFSILELWANNGKYDTTFEREINSLTQEDILYKINNVNVSGIFLIERNFTKLLSGIEKNEVGEIISAKSTLIQYFGDMNATEALLDPAKGRGEPIAKSTFEFEGEMIDVLLNDTGYPNGLEGYPNVVRSFGDVAGSTIRGDMKSLIIGYVLLFIYVQVMLGKLNCIEQRSLLAIAGISGVIMGIFTSYGICSCFGLYFGPVHNVLPFLLLGIGIDNMFVIVQCWDVLESKRAERKKSGKNEEQDDRISLSERFGHTMSSAGGAITVTSCTSCIGEY